MAVDPTSTEGLIIRKLIPLASLPSAPLKALYADMVVEEIKDDYLFKKGDTDDRLVYLIKGTVTLQAHDFLVDTINATDDSAHFALAHQIPRKIDALAQGTVRCLRLSADVINNPPPLVFQEDTGYLVSEEDDAEDWMASLLKSPVFQCLSPANLQKILMALESAEFNKGAVIAEQGQLDEFYYLIKSGTCLVTHRPSPEAKDIKLAQISKGNTLGEDALIFAAPRTESITALTPVSLLRLSRDKFISLLKTPVLKSVDFMAVQEMLISGATLLDIRDTQEYQTRHIAGSINLPFPVLKGNFKNMAADIPVIVIGHADLACEAASFFLIKHKYQALILKGGINSIKVSPENEAVFFSSGNDTSPQELVSDWNNEQVFAESDVFLPPDNDLETRLAALETENTELKQNIALLNRHCQQAEMDKAAAEKQSRILAKQVEKLTQVLNKLRGK